MTDSKYAAESDEILIARLRSGEQEIMEYLLDKYKYLVKSCAHLMFIKGGDSDDLMQEGMIGLFKAIRDYQPEEGSFSAFARLCIRRQLYTAIERANRKKHGPLNHYESLQGEMDEPGHQPSPEEILIDQETGRQFERNLWDALSSFETEVLKLYLSGMGYREIAVSVGREPKTVDNAIQRIRGKAQRLTEEKR
jgi:RNA polymerase sporulation-specific sigma factor